LPKQLKESVIVPISNKGDETGCSNYWAGHTEPRTGAT
jgi:hypothetical protein